ncbi:DUF1570 domain-containing protein [Pirellula sp. SH-Sr6A]|uniref:DUF1570 domain-containing protein n=1 Tax=Pirellula sp. SH-Sr6A TaxID=1632865 RepID=UPI00143C01A2|nr:DUF1570 domain-containing protein [Pirellula sp. SH-Sr6A]
MSCLFSSDCLGDFLVYTPPGAKAAIVLEGKTKLHSGNLLEFTYPGYPSVAMDRDQAVVVKAPTRLEEYRKLWFDATKSNSVDDYLKAAHVALRHGKLKEFYECCSAAYKREPNHPTVVRLVEARAKIKTPVQGFAETETKLRSITKLASMKVAKSEHYLLLHDIDGESSASRASRVSKRLERLETVYESFFLKFALNGIVLEAPSEPLMVLLFSEEKDYLRYATQLDPQLQSAAGFWSPKDNVSVFYDRSSTDEMRLLTALVEEMKRAKLQARGTTLSREVAQQTNSLELMVKILKDELDAEVVSHEATHQLAGNTGLMPRGKLGLSWAHEGLACYFETPSGVSSGGVGALNPRRLQGYRRLSGDPSRSRMEFLVSDYLFDPKMPSSSVVDAYGGAWALTHFLMETDAPKLTEYYRRCAELTVEAEAGIPRAKLIELFSDVFGDMASLERELREHMRDQKTDLERLREAASP